jgi:hypothetical protein
MFQYIFVWATMRCSITFFPFPWKGKTQKKLLLSPKTAVETYLLSSVYRPSIFQASHSHSAISTRSYLTKISIGWGWETLLKTLKLCMEEYILKNVLTYGRFPLGVGLKVVENTHTNTIRKHKVLSDRGVCSSFWCYLACGQWGHGWHGSGWEGAPLTKNQDEEVIQGVHRLWKLEVISVCYCLHYPTASSVNYVQSSYSSVQCVLGHMAFMKFSSMIH